MIPAIDECVPCQRRRNQLKMQLEHLRIKVKQRAVNEGRSYAIWLDEEDAKLVFAPLSEYLSRGATGGDVLSFHP